MPIESKSEEGVIVGLVDSILVSAHIANTKVQAMGSKLPTGATEALRNLYEAPLSPEWEASTKAVVLFFCMSITCYHHAKNMSPLSTTIPETWRSI